MGKVTKVGEYSVVEANDWCGIKVWALHLGNQIVLFNYMGHDPENNRYFFKARKEGNWILAFEFKTLFTPSFHPFLLDMDKVTYPEHKEGA